MPTAGGVAGAGSPLADRPFLAVISIRDFLSSVTVLLCQFENCAVCYRARRVSKATVDLTPT